MNFLTLPKIFAVYFLFVHWFFFTVQFGYQAGRLYKPANQIAEKGFPGKHDSVCCVCEFPYNEIIIFHIQDRVPHGVQRKSVLQLAIRVSCSLHD